MIGVTENDERTLAGYMNDGRRYEEVESSSVKLYSLIDNVDKFGSSVAITGGTSAGATLASVTVVVGAPGGTTGAAFVYKLDASGTVIKTFRLVTNDATSSSGFGTSVAADGDWVVVGAPREKGPIGLSHGAVYVFKRDANNDYQQMKKLVSPNPAFLNDFGESVAISGNYIVVGEPKLSKRGAAHVFKFNGADWIHERELSGTLGGTGADDFGKSVSIESCSYIVVGAPETTTNKGSDAGSAYLFNLDGTLMRTFTAVDGDSYHYFGLSVSISGNVIAVSSPASSGNKLPARRLLGNFGRPGAVYVFERKSSGSYTTNKVTASDREAGDRFGSAVSVSGDYLLVGAYWKDTPGTSEDDNTGAAYMQHVEHVSTTASGDGCSLCNDESDDIFIGECGPLSTKTDKWACDGPWCCASSSDECCEANVGAIAGLVIGCVVGLALSITGCAYCCKCCCFKPKPTTTVMTQQPVTQVAPMAQVQMQPMAQVPYGQQPK